MYVRNELAYWLFIHLNDTHCISLKQIYDLQSDIFLQGELLVIKSLL